jgi:quercetin dioxygenase-like cupin family protein
MPVFHLNDVPGTVFPAGRRTRVLAGPGAPAEPDHFVMGHTTIFPGGEVPGHAHSQEEIYFIVSGQGIMEIDQERTDVGPGNYIAIRPEQWHSLSNNSDKELVMLFCYAPKGIVDHWQQELESKEKSP